MTDQKKRSPWDTGRFLQTLTYFEIFPFLGCLKRIFGGFKQETTIIQGKAKNMGIILVVGATGGVGKRVVKSLLSQNYQVRALVRDAKKAKAILGENIDLFEADLTIPETLTYPLMDRVTSIICCSGTKVQPVEGDTPNREKYYQGVKFYLPEVVDIPEKVEYEGIKNLINIAVKSRNLRSGERLLFDFQNPTTDIKQIWGALDDVVMGGVSQSSLRLAQGLAIFSGNVSTDNNGGFASIRTRNFTPAWDLSEYEGFELRVKGDGQRYKFFARCEGKWDGIGYSYSLDTVNNFWTTIRIPFKDLIPVFRAKTVPEMGIFDPSTVYSLQLMLSKFEYDGGLNPKFEPGFFSLEIDYIKAYGGQPTPQFIMISSAGVTRPGKPGLNLEEEPPAVRLNDQLGGILTWKLRGEDIVRNSGLNYTIIRPCALTEQPGDKLLVVDQGDHIRGQVSRDAIAQLAVQALELPEATSKTFEVKEKDIIGNNNWPELLNSLKTDRS
jgi:uncharacterized protein YbjT (DUF2867 family)